MPSLKLGIAFYSQSDSRGRPSTPHWALVAHPTSYAAADVQVFQVRRNEHSWSPSHRICSLTDAPTLFGVIHIAEIKFLPVTLDAFIRPFPATKNNDDPSGNIVWSCSNWVIRILHHLTGVNALLLPWQITAFYEYIQPRIMVLKTTPMNSRVPLLVIPLLG